jgi:predicted permease
MRGRVLTEGDDAVSAPRVAVMDQALAGKVFPNEDPLGQRIRMQGEWWEVVGIVGSVHHRGLDREARGHIYMPQAFNGFPCSLVVRTRVPPLAMAEVVRRAILALDPDQPVANVRTLEQIVATAVGQRRLMLIALGLFAAVAVMLAAIGLYGVMAYSVQRRTREIGIRMALGAQRRDVLLHSLRQGLGLAALGVVVGLVGAAALTRVLAHLLFGVTSKDPATFACTAVLLLAVALLSCWLPARRAARVDPMVALRCE